MSRGNFHFLKNYTYFLPGAFQLLALLFWFLVGAMAGNMLNVILLKVAGADVVREYGTLLAYPLMFIPPMIYASFKSRAASINTEGRAVDSAHFAPTGWPLLALALVPGTLAVGIVCDWFNTLLPEMPLWLEELMESMTGGKFWINFVCVSIYAPFFEEWLCRGMVLRGFLARKVNPVVAIPASAFVFALIHMNPWQAIPAFCIGLLMGYVYYRTGSLKLTVLIHFVNNTFALVCAQSESLKEYDSWVDMTGDSYWIMFAASVVLLGLVVLLFRRVKLQSAEGNCDVQPSLFDTE